MPKDMSPGFNAYYVSRHILAEFFGEEWVRRHVLANDRPSSFFLNNSTDSLGRARHHLRVIYLVEMMWNCQWIPGYAAVVKQLFDPNAIESTYAELDIARALIVHEVKFRFNERKNRKGEDFDLFITMPNGLEVCAETKCKYEEGALSAGGIRNVLDVARKQNLPRNEPGIIFCKLPVDWLHTDEQFALISAATNEFFSRNTRIVSVKFYTSYVYEDEIAIRENMGWHEVPNRRNRFDTTTDWRLFPVTPEVARSWNGMPDHWRHILHGDNI